MSLNRPSKEIQTLIDKVKCASIDKEYSHHLIKLTGTSAPLDYAVCTDGTEIPYTKFEEDQLMDAREKENVKTGRLSIKKLISPIYQSK